MSKISELSTRKRNKYRKQLKERLSDIYAGACHGEVPDGNDYWLDVQNLPRLIAGIKERIPHEEESNYLFSVNCIDYFQTVESATDHLFDTYVRSIEDKE